jgi:uncharacterized cofD-like protein
MKKIVSIGAWTGQAAILKWLINLPETTITALVTTTDNGWSSALIRASLDIPSPGDVRNVINAINPHDDVLAKLLNYRFSEGELSWTHLGNLIVGALSRICGGYEAGILHLNNLLWLPAYVLPVSNHPAQICAELSDGTIIQGERQIIKREKQNLPITRYFLSEKHEAVQDGLHALREADVIIICPGVLGTGIISTLLFEGMRETISSSSAKIIYIANVMTYPSQTDDFTLSDHVHELESYLGKKVDIVLSNTTLPPRHILVQYARTWSYPLIVDKEKLANYTLIETDLLIDYSSDTKRSELVRASGAQQHVGAHRIRHDAEKVKAIIEETIQ